MTPDDEEFLRHAIALARASRDAGQAPYGSLLVGPGAVLGPGATTRYRRRGHRRCIPANSPVGGA